TPDDLPLELLSDIEQLNNTLANWEMSDSRKFALMWTPDKILDRHLDLPTLRKARDARKTLANTTESKQDAISRERAFLERIKENLKDTVTNENEIKSAITKLSSNREHDLPPEISTLYLTDTSRERIERINAQLRQRLTEAASASVVGEGGEGSSEAILIEDLARDKQGIFEIALRNARLEQPRIQYLLDSHETLTREYLDEELLILSNYLSSEEFKQAKEARKRIAAYLVETEILQAVKQTAASDVIALENLIKQLPSLTRDLDAQTKVLLRDNMLTLRNARFRNIQSRVETMARISEIEYNRKLAQIEAAVALQDLFNRYYTSLFCSIDLSSQSNQFGVFNKGWFYDQQPEFVLRREFASIGNKLAAYAADADFGVRVRKLWRATDDQIRQAVMARQWSVASQISDKADLEGKTLE
ncbi:MAG: hypothetical protein OXU23_05930, partial [Candidatus Poribacteria bacterium]|nr:hypothetical protein [Candidatus Poribacteria bacterium]